MCWLYRRMSEIPVLWLGPVTAAPHPVVTRLGEDFLTQTYGRTYRFLGERTGTGRHPVVNVDDAWEVRSILELTAPGVEAGYETSGRTRTAYLVHPDGSWARASAERTRPPTVHQGGPQRLWDTVERIRTWLLSEGGLPLLRAHPSSGAGESQGASASGGGAGRTAGVAMSLSSNWISSSSTLRTSTPGRSTNRLSASAMA